MRKCTDEQAGRLLHDYELGLLSESDKQRFELHLYECEYCLAEVRDFSDVVHILSRDPEARSIIGEMGDVSHHPSGERTTRWTTPLLRTLLAAAILLAVAVPTYLYFQERAENSVQTLHFSQTRSGGSDVVYLSRGGELRVDFAVSEALRGESLDIRVIRVGADTLTKIPRFSDVSDEGTGSITLPLSSFQEGHYILSISPSGDTTGSQTTQYMFRVK